MQANPEHSISYMLLAASLSRVGRLTQARAMAARLMELQPGFQYGRQFRGMDCAPALAAALGAALRATGLLA